MVTQIEWRMPREIPEIFSIAVVAKDIGAGGLLRPTPEAELAAYIDLSINQYVGEFVGVIAAAAQDFYGRISGDPIATGDVRVFSEVTRGLIRSLILNEAGVQPVELPAGRIVPSDATEEFPLASLPSLGFELFASQISLQSGSLVGRIVGAVGVQGLIALALFAGTPYYNDWHAKHLANQEIVRVTENGRCAVYFSADLDMDALRKLSSAALAEQKKSFTDPIENARRVCLTQVLLHMNNAYPGKVDGIEGQFTKEAEKEYAKKIGLKRTEVGSEAFYEALIAGAQTKR